MTLSEAIAIVFGALLALLLGFIKDIIDSIRRGKKIERVLSLQLPTIYGSVNSFSMVADKKMIPVTELPLLDGIGDEDIACLSGALASDVYTLRTLLRKAEESRKIASGLLDNQSTPTYQLHAWTYTESIKSALPYAKSVYRQLKCQPALPADAATPRG